MAPAIAVSCRSKPPRTRLSAPAAKAIRRVAALCRPGSIVRRLFPAGSPGSVGREVAGRISAAASVLRGSLTATAARTLGRGTRGIASVRRGLASLRRGLGGIRLPEIPGGDPVMFGAAAGIAIILGAGLVAAISSALREYEAEPQNVASVFSGGRSRLAAEDRQALHARLRDATRTGREAVATLDGEDVVPGPEEETDSPSLAPAPAVVASPEAQADEDENIAAALPLLDMSPPRREELPAAPQEPPEARTPSPRPEAQPLAPAVRPQWLANAVEPQRPPGDRPMIAIVIDDAGVAQARTARAIELPAPLTIAFIPYSQNLQEQTRQARKNGHELLLHMPMEPDSNAVDPGPNALLTTLGSDEIMRRFEWALARFDGYVGVNNHMGSKFMARPDLVAPLLQEINTRGLMFLDSRTDKSTVGAELALTMRVPHASRQVFLDNDLDEDKIATQLKRLERMALRHGHAIAIGHPHDVTVDVLARWIPEARARGFDLVPVSAIVKLAYGDGSESQLAAARGGETNGLLGGAQ